MGRGQTGFVLMPIFHTLIKILIGGAALQDVQVWLLALTYTGVIVSLYSFFLFL